MDSMLSRKRQYNFIFIITIVYLSVQIPVIFFNDTYLSRSLWLEHKNSAELIGYGRPATSELTPVLKAISDNHFWVLRAALFAAVLMAFYYKDKDPDKYILFRNISLSSILLLIAASGLITWALKIAVGKPRPYTKLTEIIPMSFSTRFQSFPSGHTTETFSYIFPYLYFFKSRYARALLFISGVIISSFRIFLSYHFITDVIFGIWITSAVGYIICIYIDEKSKKQAGALDHIRNF